ncbi:MAG TPA: VOC family protein, partial [Burkholderiales bacterium]
MASKSLKQLPLRLHHQAFAVQDQEKTRQFMEDVLGIPLVATWCEKVFRPEVGREVEYCHTFYELADGGAIAYFQYADEECWELNKAQPAKRGDAGALHSAFKAT